MHIKEIIIDGFKSYSVKTSVSGFDRHFNAITGLNGSGKSNILDAICFVLGITLSQVRASNLQELIYKYGNAGINKASVTIIFDNVEKKHSPMGCEEYDEIIVTRTIYQGKSKYYLNGYTATQDNIKSLFQSVQLNISNPHFLIMQGKVTQVVNMKPLEILGLLEEAAGTSIYEMKKESALKLMKKKENKLEEINKILAEEITPQLEKLMKDKQNYLTWKSRENEISRIFKILTAYDFFNMQKNLLSRSEEIMQLKKQEEEYRLDVNGLVQKVEVVNEQIACIENRFKNQIDKNVKELENRFKDITHNIKSYKHNKENILKNSENSQKEINKFELKNEKLSIASENLDKQKKDFQSNLELSEKDFESKTNFLKELERNLENVNSGKNTIEGELFNMNKLITEAKNNISKAKAEKININNQISFLSEERKKKSQGYNEFKKSMGTTKKQLSDITKEIEFLTEEMSSLEASNNNPQMQEFIMKSINEKESELSKYELKQNEILSRYASRVEVQFRDPEHSFDRRKVKGRVIRLFSLDNERFVTALEQVAGGKLFNIIVDTETTSSLLLSRKCFDYGVILIPINKISEKSIPADKMRMIQEIAGNEAKLAIDLIRFNREHLPAMQYVFGTTFVCTTSEIARKLAYNEHIRVKCVNLDGDVFDPIGTMTGGANFKQGDSILMKVQELNFLQEKINGIKQGIFEGKKELEKFNENNNRYHEVKMRLENLTNQKNSMSEETVTKKLKLMENEIDKIDDEVKRGSERIEQLIALEKKYTEECKKLESEINEFKNAGNKTKEVYGRKIKSVKEGISEIEKNIIKIKKSINDIDYNIKEKANEITQNGESIQNEVDNLETNKKDMLIIEKKIKEETDVCKKLEAELIEKKREITKNETELNNLKLEKEKMEKRRDEISMELKKVETRVTKYEKEIKETDDKLSKLELENKWISAEKDFFGIRETDYDFAQIDVKSEVDKLSKLKEENSVLRRKVNMKVDIMADQYEKEYNDLIKKREIIVKDKTNIEKAIKELDEKRKDALDDIYSQVNKNLNSIYTSLLPGTKAKLDPVGISLMEGLELKVAFNNTWKKSLSELSGGQRSLLALSLILSLLLYKPAPFYILDEIDAALDLSHTANLGHMIKEHFPQSQFIVVSLKDGMFNNANILFKVSFVDGGSKVDRISREKEPEVKKKVIK